MEEPGIAFLGEKIARRVVGFVVIEKRLPLAEVDPISLRYGIQELLSLSVAVPKLV